MSRGGYAKAEKDLLAAKRKRLEEASQSDPSVLLSPPSPIRREEKWLFAHQKRSGSYTSEQSRIVGEKIVSIVVVINYTINMLQYLSLLFISYRRNFKKNKQRDLLGQRGGMIF